MKEKERKKRESKEWHKATGEVPSPKARSTKISRDLRLSFIILIKLDVALGQEQ